MTNTTNTKTISNLKSQILTWRGLKAGWGLTVIVKPHRARFPSPSAACLKTQLHPKINVIQRVRLIRLGQKDPTPGKGHGGGPEGSSGLVENWPSHAEYRPGKIKSFKISSASQELLK